MTGNDDTLELDVSGSSARQIAQNLLTLADSDVDYNRADVRVETEVATLNPSADGAGADELVATMLAGVDWDTQPPTRIVVDMSADDTAEESFSPPEDPSEGDRMEAWQPSPAESVRAPRPGTRRKAMLVSLAKHGPATAAELADEIDYDRGSVSNDLSVFWRECGLVERAQTFSPGGGEAFTYRLNDHGRAVVGG